MPADLVWLTEDSPLPCAKSALNDPPGLVAAGGTLAPARLEEAYRKGIFPWFNPGDPVLWWSPEPRMVLMTDELHISKTLRKRLRQIHRAQCTGDYDWIITTDTALDAVLLGCANRGETQGQHQTWITPQMMQAYLKWHHLGFVHSIETWHAGALVGGLYGVCIGRQFFGESMFSSCPDASKLALAHLVFFLRNHAVQMIDCQMQTGHLASLGARPISRDDFLAHLSEAVDQKPISWSPGWLDTNGELHHDLTHVPFVRAKASNPA